MNVPGVLWTCEELLPGITAHINDSASVLYLSKFVFPAWYSCYKTMINLHVRSLTSNRALYNCSVYVLWLVKSELQQICYPNWTRTLPDSILGCLPHNSNSFCFRLRCIAKPQPITARPYIHVSSSRTKIQFILNQFYQVFVKSLSN